MSVYLLNQGVVLPEFADTIRSCASWPIDNASGRQLQLPQPQSFSQALWHSRISGWVVMGPPLPYHPPTLESQEPWLQLLKLMLCTYKIPTISSIPLLTFQNC